jgi:hypothetical protein
MPSIKPTIVVLAPTAVREMGSRLWMSSDEMSISRETKPSAHTLAGTSRQVAGEVFPVSEFICQI